MAAWRRPASPLNGPAYAGRVGPILSSSHKAFTIAHAELRRRWSSADSDSRSRSHAKRKRRYTCSSTGSPDRERTRGPKQLRSATRARAADGRRWRRLRAHDPRACLWYALDADRTRPRAPHAIRPIRGRAGAAGNSKRDLGAFPSCNSRGSRSRARACENTSFYNPPACRSRSCCTAYSSPTILQGRRRMRFDGRRLPRSQECR